MNADLITAITLTRTHTAAALRLARDILDAADDAFTDAATHLDFTRAVLTDAIHTASTSPSTSRARFAAAEAGSAHDLAGRDSMVARADYNRLALIHATLTRTLPTPRMNLAEAEDAIRIAIDVLDAALDAYTAAHAAFEDAARPYDDGLCGAEAAALEALRLLDLAAAAHGAALMNYYDLARLITHLHAEPTTT